MIEVTAADRIGLIGCPRPIMRLVPCLPAAALVILVGSAAPASAIDPRPPREGRVWYVDNTAVPDGDGSMVAPFDRLSRAERAADVGDTIYVFRGDGTARGLDGGIRLRRHQRLVGSGAALDAAGEEALPAGEPPLVAAAAGPAVTLADFTSVEGLTLAGGGPSVVAGSEVVGVRLRNLRVDASHPTGVAVELAAATDTTLDEITASAARIGVRLTTPNGVTLRHCRVTGTGADSGGTALLATDSAGLLRLESTDLVARGGTPLSIESHRGQARVELERVSVSGASDAPPSTVGIVVRTGGEASLTVAANSSVLDRVAGEGVSLVAEGRARLRLELAGNGLVGEAGARQMTAVSAVARQGGTIDIAAHGNDLPARETGLLLAANGAGRLHVELTANVIGGSESARGVVVLLGDAAEAALVMSKNHITGQRAEGLYAVASSQTFLGIDASDNDLASGTATETTPFPAVLLETRDGSRGCLSLAGNRFADGAGGGPSVRLRQRGESGLAVTGYEPTAAGGPAVRLTATNRLGRVEIESERQLAPAAGPPCPAAPAQQPAVAATP